MAQCSLTDLATVGAVLSIKGFETIEWAISGILEEQGDVIIEILLVLLDSDDIIGSRIDNCFDDSRS